MSALSKETEADLRAIAREGYIKFRINREKLPHPDTDEGQQKIERLFDIMAEPFRAGENR